MIRNNFLILVSIIISEDFKKYMEIACVQLLNVNLFRSCLFPMKYYKHNQLQPVFMQKSKLLVDFYIYIFFLHFFTLGGLEVLNTDCFYGFILWQTQRVQKKNHVWKIGKPWAKK